MSYQVLARKWRPQTFAEMAGQQHVLRALVNAIDSKQLHHAYLFTGTRGVGKTTVARILAKCLNCETGITSTPCGTCSSCQDIRDGKFLDLIEVDAASRTKVEQTRELLENVAYAPTRGRFKIYLIDEVHMLSTNSFNALLKTLEEPPLHVKFFLATTDPERLPMTVLSRCLRFHLKNMPQAVIQDYLADILNKEHIPFAKEATALLARAAEGSMRDGLSLLDQAIAYGKGNLDEASVRELLGFIDPEVISHLLHALQKDEGEALFVALDKAMQQGADPLMMLDALIEALHEIAMHQILPQHQTQYVAFAQHFTPEDVQLFYQIAQNARRDLPWMGDQRLGLEMNLLRMLAFMPKKITACVKPASVIPAKQESQNLRKDIQNPAPLRTEKSKETQEWSTIVPNLGLTGLSMALASHCILKSKQDNQWKLALSPQHAPLLNGSAITRIEQALREYTASPISLKINIEEDIVEETIAAAKIREEKVHQEKAEVAITGDVKVQAMIEQLGASIVKIDKTGVLS